MILGPVHWSDVRGKPWESWGEVTSTVPLQVTLEGDDDPTDVPAGNTLVGGLAVGDIVWCRVNGRQLIILGRSGG